MAELHSGERCDGDKVTVGLADAHVTQPEFDAAAIRQPHDRILDLSMQAMQLGVEGSLGRGH